MIKKRIIITFICAAMLMFGAAGCGGETKVITGSSAVKGSNSGANNTGDYIFKAKGVDIIVNGEVKEVLEKLGKPLSQFEAPSCAFGLRDVTYTYAGFDIDTFCVKEKKNGQDVEVEYIKDVYLKDDSVSTSEGVSIGEDAEKIEKIYGNPSKKSDSGIEYSKDKMKLEFVIKGGKVEEIQYHTLRTKE